MSRSAITTNSIADFHGIHAGETCLLVGNGPNLHLTPPAWFSYPSFGMNTIHLYEGWEPTYFVGVDSRLMREYGEAIATKYKHIPKFIPYPNLDKWQGENFFRFYHRPGPLWPDNGWRLFPPGIMTEQGITYGNVMHVAMQFAYFMGFTTLLMIGVKHHPSKGNEHFWGADHGMGAYPPYEAWFEGYRELAQGFAANGVQVWNISPETCVPEDILPRADWRTYEDQI